LAERRIEVAVVPMLSPPPTGDLDATILYRDSWHVVAGIKSPWAHRKKVDLVELVDASWCATPLETSIGSLLADAFLAKGLDPPRLTVSSVISPPIVARFLEDDRFVAVIADSLLNFFYARRLPLKKLPIELGVPQFAVAIVTLKGRTISPVAQMFLDQARDVGRELTKRLARYGGRVRE